MIELNVNFEELEHMDLEEAKEIVNHFDNEDWYEELGATVDGIEYVFKRTPLLIYPCASVRSIYPSSIFCV